MTLILRHLPAALPLAAGMTTLAVLAAALAVFAPEAQPLLMAAPTGWGRI